MTKSGKLGRCVIGLVWIMGCAGLAVPAQAADTRPTPSYRPALTPQKNLPPPPLQYSATVAPIIRAIDPSRYVLGAGDLLMVALWGSYSEVHLQTVSADGKLILPVLGALQVSGLTIVQAEALLHQRVVTYYKNVESGIAIQGLRPDMRVEQEVPHDQPTR